MTDQARESPTSTRLRLWLDAFYVRGEFDDRTLIALFRAEAGKVVVKLHLRHTLHAKLYLCFRSDPNNPITGFLGSSNLTLSGLSGPTYTRLRGFPMAVSTMRDTPPSRPSRR